MKINPIMSYAAAMLFVFTFVTGPVLAQAVAAIETSVPVAPWYDLVSAVAITFAGVAATVLGTVATFYLNKWFGIKVDDTLRNTLHSAAVTGASSALQHFRGRFEDQNIDVRNAAVAQAIEWVRVKGAPTAIEKFNLTEQDLTEIVLSKIPAIEGGVAPTTTEAPPAVQG